MTKDSSSTPQVRTITEAAKILRISRNSAYAAVKTGDIPAIKIGRRLLVPHAALDRLLGKQVN